MTNFNTIDYGGIPIKVLRGDVPEYRSVHLAYKNHFIAAFMYKVHLAFWVKAKRGTDDLGRRWKPLAPDTHKRKQLSPIESGTFRVRGRLAPGTLTPSQLAEWKLEYIVAYDNNIERGQTKKEARRLASWRAWRYIKQKYPGKVNLDSEGQRLTDTNIRTGALVNAIRPGKVVNNRYYPPAHQIIGYDRRKESIDITIAIDYFEKVQSVRPVFPDVGIATPWIIFAHRYGIVHALPLYSQLKKAQDAKKVRKAKKALNARKNAIVNSKRLSKG